LLSFIAMQALGLTANIMSLGGIVIAVGAMVDASIVMIEGAHQRLEQDPVAARDPSLRREIIIGAAKDLGRPLFFSLLIITVSFLPVFTLEAQEGRLFKPLAFTKTFAMFFASILSITLVPLLMVAWIRGHITPVAKNPVNRALTALYAPVARLALRHGAVVIVIALLFIVGTVPVYRSLGSEFMPPLNEGTILYMPTALPGISITKATQVLQQQNALLKTIPEVETVFGKIGRAETATDPAPLSMAETTITLKPESQWRPGMTWDGLIAEMDRLVRFPGMPNIWWMPIQTRTEMLATGVRSEVGIKVLGRSLEDIDRVGQEIEGTLADLPGTRSAFAERVTGAYYLDVTVDRRQAARYNLTVADVEQVIESAIGGVNVTTTVEGRERYSVNVRYARELREDPEHLKRVLVPTPSGAQIPLAQLARFDVAMGPSMVRDENGSLAGIVYVDVEGRDLAGYVQDAKRRIAERVELPTGASLIWAGSYEYLLRAQDRMKIVVPVTLLLVFVLLYLNFRSVAQTLIVLLSIPFAVVGSVLLLGLLGYNLSVAVWVGIIALAGVAAETGVIMLIYLDEAYDRWRAEGRLHTRADVVESVIEGAVLRVRPKAMTVAAIIFGLLPIMWSHGAGADVMKRIAAPMIGGMVTSTLLTLIVIPVIYAWWRGRSL
jgi:Cu(I)/Ag(I) efflux system membrane protein CusA/SilA